VKKINDQGLLQELYRGEKNSFVRMEMANRATEFDFLRMMAEYDSDQSVQQNAYNRIELLRLWRHTELKEIKNQNELYEIAKNDSYAPMREAAVNNPFFTNQAELADIALHDRDQGVSTAALNKINNLDLLAKIAANAWDASIRSEAGEKWRQVQEK